MKKKWISVYIIILLIGCNRSNSNFSQSSFPEATSSKMESQSNRTPTFTGTAPNPSTTLEFTPQFEKFNPNSLLLLLPEFPETSRILMGCPDNIFTQLPENVFSGTIVLQDINSPETSLVLWDLVNNAQMVIFPDDNPDSEIWNTVISPDGTKLLYHEVRTAANRVQTDWLIILSPRGEKILEKKWEPEWDWIGYWLTNNKVVIETYDDNLIIYDPFSGAQKEILLDTFPDQYDSSIPLYQWQKHIHGFVVSPSENYLVYPDTSLVDYLVWDLNKNERISILQSTSWQISWHPSVWSDKEDKFLLGMSIYGENNHDELFLMTPDGKGIQLTEFSNIFTKGQDINQYGWSPDEKSISFKLGIIGIPIQEYFPTVLDLETNTTQIFCIGHDGWYPPIWSPDGKNLMIMSYDINNPYTTHVIIINIQQNSFFWVGDNYEALGWMMSK